MVYVPLVLALTKLTNVFDSTALTAKDVLESSDKFWALQSDPRLPLDCACYTILAAHVGLAIGTLAKFADYRRDVADLVKSMLKFDTVGLFLLSERGHGLDAFNIETTATLTADGFILNTPREEASKYVEYGNFRDLVAY